MFERNFDHQIIKIIENTDDIMSQFYLQLSFSD